MKERFTKSFFSKAASKMANPLRQAVSNVLDTLHSKDMDEEQLATLQESVMLLFIHIMKADGTVDDSEVEIVTSYFKETYGQDSVNRFMQLLNQKDLKPVEEVCEALSEFTNGEKRRILSALLNVGYADGSYDEPEKEKLAEISKFLEIDTSVLHQLEKDAERAVKAHTSLVRSSAGLISAFIIIIIFILMATYLKSVLFGIILAYFFLPLQRWYADSFFNKGLISKFINFIQLCCKPFKLFVSKVRGLFSRGKVSQEKLQDTMISEEDKRKKTLLRQSCHATVLTVVLSGAAAVFLVFWISSGYFTKAKKTLEEVEEQQQKTEEPYVQSIVNKFNPRLMEIPIVERSIKFLEDFLADEKKMNEMKENFKEKYGGLFGITMTILGGAVSFLLNLLLTLFFFSFFLDKMAEFQLDSEQRKSIGDYLVESIFDSGWLPKTSQETQKGAAGIIDVIAMKMQTWVRGYLWIIIIESIIYTMAFIFIGVPYAVILGGIAGLTVLLPFLGPLASALLTIIVCAATGNVSPAFLALVIGVYCVMNMIVEQLFLYPAFVGEALGLNILETIAVVLLGGLLAGLAGVIFAVPAASVLKYLIPKVYRSVSSQRKGAGKAASQTIPVE